MSDSQKLSERVLVLILAASVVWMGALEILYRHTEPSEEVIDRENILLLSSVVGVNDVLVKRIRRRVQEQDLDDVPLARGRARASLDWPEESGFLKERDRARLPNVLGLQTEE